ncbi:PREDICTED: uncharacterized protein LOC104733668 [Camelina sativa]|uniref:Uncharacterized protein LOC104733668 n=1 Tax=Camelina sativa TaxID=90675 RepID=A0ABM0V6C0_CAMSA|nr:PREDICTED: uncharacterized protein LOC104733668 [Camelina sativa]
MPPKGKGSSRAHGARTATGVRIFNGNNRSSSHSSNPSEWTQSATQPATHSHQSHPSQIPPRTNPAPITSPSPSTHPPSREVPELGAKEKASKGWIRRFWVRTFCKKRFMKLLGEFGTDWRWFNRHKGKLSRAIAGFFRRNFDGPYYSWKVTPLPIQERYFRAFARKYNWDIGSTNLVKEGFLKIVKKRMKGNNTPYAIEKSENASQCRNSTHGGLGVHKHLAGQKSFVQAHQEMEEELGRHVSLVKVFLKTHTRPDGSFVDQKAKQVAETYEKTIEERQSETDEDGPDSSENSTHRNLSLDERNEISLQCTHTDNNGNLFELGSLVETLKKRKKTKSYASASPSTLVELQDQLRCKISEHETENARRDQEHQESQAEMKKLFLFMIEKKT